MAFLIPELWIFTPKFIHSGKGLAQSGFYTFVQGLCFAGKKSFTCLLLELPSNPLTVPPAPNGCITLGQLLLKTTKFRIYIITHIGLTQNTFYFSDLPPSLLHHSWLSSSSCKIITGLLRETQLGKETKIHPRAPWECSALFWPSSIS